MNDDTAVIYLLSDIKTRLNHIVKVMRGVFETVRQNKANLCTTTSLV